MIAIKKMCSVENLNPPNLDELSRFARMILHEISFFLILENTRFQVNTVPSFQDRKFGFNQEPFTITDKVKVVGHLLSIFPHTFVVPRWNRAGIIESALRISQICRCIFLESQHGP